MLGWHQYRSELPKGFHEGSDEVMLALYKLNELIFEAKYRKMSMMDHQTIIK